jgi:hypothetical protein
MASGFHGLIKHRLQHERQQISPALPIIREAVQYILRNLDKYGFELDGGSDLVYGDIAGKYHSLLEQLD